MNITKIPPARSLARSVAHQAAAKQRVVSMLCKLSTIILLAILLAILVTAFTGCAGFSAAVKQTTDYGTATIRTQGGKTSVEFELPRQ